MAKGPATGKVARDEVSAVIVTDKLTELLKRCKCGVLLTINEHRDFYETAEDAILEQESFDRQPVASPSVRAQMIASDTIIKLQFYPDTPIGFYRLWHHDLDAILDAALKCLDQ